jgi:hypothetical protein
MNSEMQKRLYEMEVMPPAAVWEKLSVNIDEINEDIDFAKKVLNAELTPPQGVWEKIDSTINPAEERQGQRTKRPVILLRRLAVAAILIGVIVMGWIVLRNSRQDRGGLVNTQQDEKSKTGEKTTRKDENPTLIDSQLNRSNLDLTRTDASQNTPNTISGNIPQSFRSKRNNSSRNRNNLVARRTAQYASLNQPLGKSFNQPIDDLSLVTSDQNYLTMVNANGRLVKIPAQLASLAPHLQDKPVAEDYYEVMFGEGSYWKETLNEWRKKLLSAPVTSGDAFTSFVELLKSVQNK